MTLSNLVISHIWSCDRRLNANGTGLADTCRGPANAAGGVLLPPSWSWHLLREQACLPLPPHRELAGTVSVLSLPALISYGVIKEHFINKYLTTSFPSHFQVSVFCCKLSFLLWSLTNHAGHRVPPQSRRQQVAVSLGELFKKYASRGGNQKFSVSALSVGACEEISSTILFREIFIIFHFNLLLYLCVCILLFL